MPMSVPALLLIVLLSFLATPSPAFAIDPAYLGYWAEDAKACTYHDAFEITPEGFSAHEEDCRTKDARKEGKGWVLRLRCAGEGSESNVTLHWQLGQDGRLRATQNGQTTTYVRCGKMTR
jgi:hypothetical protein